MFRHYFKYFLGAYQPAKDMQGMPIVCKYDIQANVSANFKWHNRYAISSSGIQMRKPPSSKCYYYSHFWYESEELEEATIFKMLLSLLLFWHSNEELEEATVFKMLLLLPFLAWKWGTSESHHLWNAIITPPIPGFEMGNLIKPLSLKCYYYCSRSCTNKK